MTLTPIQEDIIKEVCKLQEESINRVMMDIILGKGENDYILLLDQHQVSSEDYVKILIETKNTFSRIYEKPNEFLNLKNIDMSLFRHILFNLLDTYKSKYPVAYKGIWRKVFLNEDIETLLIN